MQRHLAFELRKHAAFVCLDDKAKIPIGEPNQPMATGVRSRPSLAADSSILLGMDHDRFLTIKALEPPE